MLIELKEAVRLINEGRTLHIAADDSLLKQLPKGKWIGGTTPYFIGEEGGIFTRDLLYVNEIDYAEEINVRVYGKYNIFQLVEECYDNGLAILIMPYGSEVAAKYAKEAPDVEELLMHPTLGWISGFDLETAGEARVYDGTTGTSYTDRAVVMYLKLPEGRTAMINMINIFEDDKTDPVIHFRENDLSVENCTVNGSYFNISVKSIENGRVSFYAPVFKNVDYRFAVRVDDYAAEFMRRIGEAGARNPVISCNCILNYQYGELDGKRIPPYTGPVTFGELAYQLLNQTLVYCEIVG